ILGLRGGPVVQGLGDLQVSSAPGKSRQTGIMTRLTMFAATRGSIWRATLMLFAACLWVFTNTNVGSAQNKVSIIYPEATGSFLVLLAIAQQQDLFKKVGVDAQSVAVRGVPR